MDQKLFRPSEIQEPRGDASLARARIGWYPMVEFSRIVEVMVEADLRRLSEDPSVR